MILVVVRNFMWIIMNKGISKHMLMHKNKRVNMKMWLEMILYDFPLKETFMVMMMNMLVKHNIIINQFTVTWRFFYQLNHMQILDVIFLMTPLIMPLTMRM